MDQQLAPIRERQRQPLLRRMRLERHQPRRAMLGMHHDVADPRCPIALHQRPDGTRRRTHQVRGLQHQHRLAAEPRIHIQRRAGDPARDRILPPRCRTNVEPPPPPGCSPASPDHRAWRSRPHRWRPRPAASNPPRAAPAAPPPPQPPPGHAPRTPPPPAPPTDTAGPAAATRRHRHPPGATAGSHHRRPPPAPEARPSVPRSRHRAGSQTRPYSRTPEPAGQTATRWAWHPTPTPARPPPDRAETPRPDAAPHARPQPPAAASRDRTGASPRSAPPPAPAAPAPHPPPEKGPAPAPGTPPPRFRNRLADMIAPLSKLDAQRLQPKRLPDLQPQGRVVPSRGGWNTLQRRIGARQQQAR